MQMIEIDAEVFRYLKEHLEPFVDKTPNDVLRRLFALPTAPGTAPRRASDATRPVDSVPSPSRQRSARKRQAKAQLSVLVENGVLRNGETLTLQDYRRTPVKGSQAKVMTGALHWNGASYSMSELASQLLQKEGYVAEAVRGPAHWVNGDGVSVSQLWERYMSGR